MKEELIYIGEKIIESIPMIVQEISEIQDPAYTEKVDRGILDRKSILEWRGEFIQLIGEILYKNRDEVFSRARDWATRTGETAIRNSIPVNETLIAMADFRTVIWDIFSQELTQQKLSALTILDASKLIDTLLNEVNFVISQIYVLYKQQELQASKKAFEELSVPVVPVANGIAVLPLIGGIDTDRARSIMEVSLQQSAKLFLNYLFIDVSGVPLIDTMVADYLFKIVEANKLLGVEVILTGIRPEIAQTLVSLGIKFNHIKTNGDLARGLSEIGFKLIT